MSTSETGDLAKRHSQLNEPAQSGALERRLANGVQALKAGHFIIKTPSGLIIEARGALPGPQAHLHIHKWRTLRRLMLGGDIGFAESYFDGDWSSPDVTALVELAAINEQALASMTAGNPLVRLLSRIKHIVRANTRWRSRKNIEAHYDLGNDFYKQWLDQNMTYSSAIYASPDQSLEEAQESKLDRIFEKLNLSGGERVLEIGCGWGRLAERLTSERNCSVTGLTLSPSQLKIAAERLEKAGAAERAEFRLQDYRDVKEKFDRVVSIEMIEAVGEQYWPAYFGKIYDCLKPGGRAVLQVISIAEERFDAYRKNADFIQRYIFPGGMLPSHGVMVEQVAKAKLILTSCENFGLSYARTLQEWNRRFQSAWPNIQTLGFDTRFKRMWEYYLAYCEGGFRSGAINVGLYVIDRPSQDVSAEA